MYSFIMTNYCHIVPFDHLMNEQNEIVFLEWKYINLTNFCDSVLSGKHDFCDLYTFNQENRFENIVWSHSFQLKIRWAK